MIKKLFSQAVAATKYFHTSKVASLKCVRYGAMSTKLKAKQARFQADNHLPVHLKGGIKDQILYRSSVALTIGCLIYSEIYILELTTKQ